MSAILDTHDKRIEALKQVKSIALVGASANPDRPSYEVLDFLIGMGYELYPVNPGLVGSKIINRPVYARLSDIPVHFDMVDIFRNSAAVDQVLEDVKGLSFVPRIFWMQLGVVNEPCAKRAVELGMDVVMNHCPLIELSQGH